MEQSKATRSGIRCTRERCTRERCTHMRSTLCPSDLIQRFVCSPVSADRRGSRQQDVGVQRQLHGRHAQGQVCAGKMPPHATDSSRSSTLRAPHLAHLNSFTTRRSACCFRAFHRRVVGIVTERDHISKVVRNGKDPNTLTVQASDTMFSLGAQEPANATQSSEGGSLRIELELAGYRDAQLRL